MGTATTQGEAFQWLSAEEAKAGVEDEARDTQIFEHPALMDSLAELNYVKDRIAAGEEPWISALAKLQGWTPAGLSHAPEPREKIACGSYSNPKGTARNNLDF